MAEDEKSKDKKMGSDGERGVEGTEDGRGTERRGYGVIKNGSGTEFCTASAADNSCPNLELCNDFFGYPQNTLCLCHGVICRYAFM